MWLPEAWDQYKAAREALANTTGSTEVTFTWQEELTFFAGEARCRRDRRSCKSSDVPVVRLAHGGSCHCGYVARLSASDPLCGEREQCCSKMAPSSFGSTHSCSGTGDQPRDPITKMMPGLMLMAFIMHLLLFSLLCLRCFSSTREAVSWQTMPRRLLG